MNLSRAKFEELTRDLVQRCRIPFEKVIADAKIDKSAIDEIVLVGGSTRMPMVQDLVRELRRQRAEQGREPGRGRGDRRGGAGGRSFGRRQPDRAAASCCWT